MEDLEVLKNILTRQSSLVQENKKLKEENEAQLNVLKDTVRAVEKENGILQEEVSTLKEECEALKGQMDAKCNELKYCKAQYDEHKEKIYNHLLERVKEMKVLYRDFSTLKKDHEENVKQMSELKAALEEEKNVQAEAQKSFKQLEEEVACLKENLNQKNEKLLEKDKIIQKNYANLQAAEKALNVKRITGDKMVQTDPCLKPQIADAAILTDPEPAENTQWYQELPEVGWVQEDGFAKLLLTFKVDKVSSADRGPRSDAMPVRDMKRKLPLCDGQSESSDVPEKKVLRNELKSPSAPCKLTKVEETASDCESKMDVTKKSLEKEEESLSVTRKEFLQNLQKMRDFETQAFDEENVKTQKTLLFQSMWDLMVNREEEYVVDEILNHLLTRQSDLSLSREKKGDFAVSEQLIASCLVKFISKKEPEMVNIFLRKVLELISSKDYQSTMGCASMCIVFSFICRKYTHIPNMRALCYEILMHRKEIAGFVIACIYCVNEEAIEFSDSRVARVWLERVIWHILSRKPSNISEEKWKETISIHRENVQFRDKSHESSECLLQEIMSAIKKHKRASLTDLVEDFGNALKLLASYNGKEWTEAVMQKHFVLYKSCIRKPEQHTNILQLLKKLECDMAAHFGENVSECERETTS